MNPIALVSAVGSRILASRAATSAIALLANQSVSTGLGSVASILDISTTLGGLGASLMGSSAPAPAPSAPSPAAQALMGALRGMDTDRIAQTMSNGAMVAGLASLVSGNADGVVKAVMLAVAAQAMAQFAQGVPGSKAHMDKVEQDFAPIWRSMGYRTSRDPDGSIVMHSQPTRDANGDIHQHRYRINADGTLDAAFHRNGKPHRDDGPARFSVNLVDGAIADKAFLVDGNELSPVGMSAHVARTQGVLAVKDAVFDDPAKLDLGGFEFR